MNNINILIVEDESIVAMETEAYVTELGYNVVDICSNGEDALAISESRRVDILLMDICIKGNIDGIETTERIKRAHPKTEVIFLTAHMDDYNVDRAIALNPVAYLSKPFQHEELRIFLKIASKKVLGQVHTTQRHPHHFPLDEEFCYNTETSLLYCCDELLHLTKKEGELLYMLVKNKNRIVDTITIENLLWPDKSITPNTLRTLVRRLREKLKYRFIETVSGQGYILRVDYKNSN